MRILANIINTLAPNADYPKGNIRDRNEAIDPVEQGTPVIEAVYGDIIQFFQKLVNDAGIVENDLPDNVTNNYQLVEAVEIFIRSLLSTTDEFGVVEKGTDQEIIDQEADKNVTADNLAAVTGGLVWATFDLGDWNMDITDTIAVDIGIDASKIKVKDVQIRNDSNSIWYDLFTLRPAGIGGSFQNMQGNIVNIERTPGGIFDSAIFSATSYNRGTLTIGYLP